MGVPRIGRSDLRGDRGGAVRGGLVHSADPVQRLLTAPDVVAQLAALPSALSIVATRLRPLARRERDFEVLAQLDAVQDRAAALYFATGKARGFK